jgi:hypothetical protein
MRSLDEILSNSPRRKAFANGHSWDRWSYRWCDQCLQDINEDCPLIAAAMLGKVTPTEWSQVGIEEYDCSEFEPREES